MTNPFYDPDFDSLFQQGGPSSNMNYTQAAHNNTLRYLRPNDLSVQVHGPCLQSPGTLSNFNQNVSTASASNDIDFIRYDTANTSPRAPSVKESPCERISTAHASCSRHPKPSNNTSQFKCGWKDCTNSHVYTRELSLWRHIKDKHVNPDAFKCNFSRCGNAYGRKDKLQEHVRSTHVDTGKQNSEHCWTCHA